MGYNIIDYTECSLSQIQDIYHMRNLPEIRKYAFDTNEISLENHLNFIVSLKNNPRKHYYAVYKDGELVGCYNLHFISDGLWERGIFAIPSHQGKGETINWENQILSSLDPTLFKIIEARVKFDNIPSIKYHEKLGFVKVGQKEDYIIYNKNL